MKRYIITTGLVLSGFLANAQIYTPVKWAYAAKKLNKAEAVVLIKATIDKGWHIYSQNVADGGPSKTALTFSASNDYSLVEKTTEPKPLKKFEKAFDMNVSYFENTVIFQQKVKLNGDAAIVKGSVNFMACSNKECLPPEDVEFSVPVK